LRSNNSLKILIVGSDFSWAIENYYVKHFTELGLNIKFFPAQTLFYKYYYSNILNKILYKIHLSKIENKINDLFVNLIKSFKPSHVFIFKGMEIKPRSLEFAKLQGVKLVNYNPDNPFLFTGKGSGNSNISNSIDLYDYHFTYNLEIKKQLEEKHKAITGFLPFGSDLSQGLYNECANELEIMKSCFVGNPDNIRAKFVQELAENGVLIDVFGNDWDNYVSHKNINTHDAVYGNEQWKTLRKYRLQINLMRIHNKDSHNMRTFEIPSIGGIQVAPFTKEHQMFFEDGKEIFLYSNLEECIKKINYLTSLSNQKANIFREFSRAAFFRGKHSYKDRAFQVLKVLENL